MNEGHTPIIYSILVHLSPWDRTQNAALVCRKWAEVARIIPKMSACQRRMAWVVWKHVLEEKGQFGCIIRKSLPAPCMNRNYLERATELFQILSAGKQGMIDPWREIVFAIMPPFLNEQEYSNTLYKTKQIMRVLMNHPHFDIEKRRIMGNEIIGARTVFAIKSTIRAMLGFVDPNFWSWVVSESQIEYKPLHVIYQRLIQALDHNFGIFNIQYSLGVRKELERGPERERLRQAKRNKKDS